LPLQYEQREPIGLEVQPVQTDLGRPREAERSVVVAATAVIECGLQKVSLTVAEAIAMVPDCSIDDVGDDGFPQVR
jgi:hypothetical protein